MTSYGKLEKTIQRQVIPSEISYNSSDDFIAGINSKRTTKRVTPVNSILSTNGGSRTAIFYPPPLAGFLDTSSILLNFTLDVACGGTFTYLRPVDNILSLIKTVRIYLGSSLVDEYLAYDLYINQHYRVKASTEFCYDTLGQTSGFGSPTQRNAFDGRSFSVPFVTSLLTGLPGSPPKYFPSILCDKSPLRIEITLNTPAACLETDSNDLSALHFTLSGLYLSMDYCLIDEMYINSFKQQAQRSGIKFPYNTMTYHSDSIAAGVNNFTARVSSSEKNLKTIISTFRLQADINNPLVNDRISSYEPVVQRLLYRINGFNSSDEPYDSTNLFLYEALKAFQISFTHQMHSKSQLNIAESYHANPIYALNCSSFPNESGKILTGIDTSSSNYSLEILVQQMVVSNALLMETFVVYDSLLIFSPDGSVSKLS
jgi:hypothetical protein